MAVLLGEQYGSISPRQTIILPANGSAGCPTWDETLVSPGSYQLPTTESEASSTPASWTIGSQHLWTMPAGITCQWNACIVVAVRNDSGGTVTVNKRPYRNGGALGGTGSGSFLTGTFNTYGDSVRVTTGDTLQLRLWAATALDVRWYGMYVIPTRVWFTHNPEKLIILDWNFTTGGSPPNPTLGNNPQSILGTVSIYPMHNSTSFNVGTNAEIKARLAQKPVAFTEVASSTNYAKLGLWSAGTENVIITTPLNGSASATEYPRITLPQIPRNATFRSIIAQS